MTNSIALTLKLQQNLMTAYSSHHGLPKAPINIDSPEGQGLIRELIDFMLEETSELFTAYFDYSHYITNNLRDIPKGSTLQDIAEEGADVMHFLLEILVFSSVSEVDIRAKLEELKADYFESTELMLDSFIDNTLVKEGLVYNPLSVYPLVSPSDKGKIGSRISAQAVQVLPILLWDLTNAMMMAQRKLRIKPWKKTRELTEVDIYKGHLAHAYIIFIAVLKSMGGDIDNIYKAYIQKNDKNFLRIKENY